MKNRASVGTVLIALLLGTMLLGDRYVMRAAAGEEPATAATNILISTETNLATKTDTNSAPLNTLLGSSLPQEIDPASPFGQLVRLVQAGVEESVILAYIKNSPQFFEIDADDIIYLTDLGAPAEIIEAIMAHDQELFEEGTQAGELQAEEIAGVVEEEPPEVTVNEFYNTLSPYGKWVYIEDYGRCWRPTVVVYNSDWRPYCDNGRWVYTDSGWYWMSNYSWGWATFHYGRWFRHARYGWCWWPDTVWAPSWVVWRYDNSYCGWAPLPPRSYYRSGVGMVYRGSVISAGFSFNLNHSYFTFVSYRHFRDPNPRRHCVDRKRAEHIYSRTRADCRYDVGRHRNTLINRGFPASRISSVTQQKLTPVSVRYRQGTAARNGRFETLDRGRSELIVNRHRAVNNPRRSTQPVSGTRRNIALQNTRKPVNSNPSVNRVNPDRASRSNVNRQSTRPGAGSRNSVSAPVQNEPRSAPSGNVNRRSEGVNSRSNPSTRPSASRQNGNRTGPQARVPQQRSSGSTTAPQAGNSPKRKSGAGIASQRRPQAQVRQQRPITPPASPRNSQVDRRSSSRANQGKVQSNNNRSRPAPKVNNSRKPGASRSATPPPQSRRTRNMEDDG